MTDARRAAAPKPDLVLLTARFPYDGSEAVLGGELDVTAARFRRVFVIPSETGTTMCRLPPNVHVVDLAWEAGWERRAKLRALLSSDAAAVVAATLRRPSNWSSYLRGARSYLDLLARNLLRARRLRGWIQSQGLGQAIVYDYWFENTTLAVALLRRAREIPCALSRAHRFDVYDVQWSDLGRVPFREFKAAHLDAVFAVSEDGAAYLRSRFGRDSGKVHVARLGVPPGEMSTDPPSDPPLVVSCGVLLPRKRIDLIPSVLSAAGRPVRWVHFGDGPDRERVEAEARKLPSTVQWELAGWVDNAEVRRFYGRERVSALLSVSLSEGIPVAMMEAQSSGVPIVAIGVGGIREIVSAETGVLLDEDASPAELAAALDDVLAAGRFEPAAVRSRFLERFDAETNYAAFADEITALWNANRVA